MTSRQWASMTYRQALDLLVEAALDQPQPTKQLQDALNRALRVVQHPLAQPKEVL